MLWTSFWASEWPGPSLPSITRQRASTSAWTPARWRSPSPFSPSLPSSVSPSSCTAAGPRSGVNWVARGLPKSWPQRCFSVSGWCTSSYPPWRHIASSRVSKSGMDWCRRQDVVVKILVNRTERRKGFKRGAIEDCRCFIVRCFVIHCMFRMCVNTRVFLLRWF